MRLPMSIALVAMMALPALARAPSAVGLWEQRDAPGEKVNAIVKIVEKDGVFSGSLDTLFPDPGDDPNPRCKNCTGADRGKPLKGLTFITGMRRDGLDYEGGKILDPDSGSKYDATMKVSADGERLTVRGYIGISLFGQSQVWTRAH